VLHLLLLRVWPVVRLVEGLVILHYHRHRFLLWAAKSAASASCRSCCSSSSR
jgi:hypothetical protein